MIADKKEYTKEEYEAVLNKAKEACAKDKENVLSLGGLHIIGTERHEARRIDNQLRGRSGRQGDPGSSRFYLSLEDDLMRIFGSDRISGLMGRLGMEEDMPIEHRLITRSIEGAQKKVEAHNFDIRKHLIEYDDVMNKQRTEIYSFRREILTSDSLKEKILEMADNVLSDIMAVYCPEDKHADEWDIKGLKEALHMEFSITPEIDLSKTDNLFEQLSMEIRQFYEDKGREMGEEPLRYLEKVITLQVLDAQWKDHLLAMDHLKEGVGLRGYAQKDPLVEYKKEAFDIFSELSGRVSAEAVGRLMRLQLAREEDAHKKVAFKQTRMHYGRGGEGSGGDGDHKPQTVVKEVRIGRNDPCICGSGKKYKKCCGQNA